MERFVAWFHQPKAKRKAKGWDRESETSYYD